MLRRALAGFVVLLTAPLALDAQQLRLAEVAEKERARRATIANPARVYTNDDLSGGARLTTASRATVTDTDERSLEAATDSDEDVPSAEPAEAQNRPRLATKSIGAAGSARQEPRSSRRSSMRRRYRTGLTGYGRRSPRATIPFSARRSSAIETRLLKGFNRRGTKPSGSIRKFEILKKKPAGPASHRAGSGSSCAASPLARVLQHLFRQIHGIRN